MPGTKIAVTQTPSAQGSATVFPAYVKNPLMPGGDGERFYFHIAASVEIDETTYVVDPLWNWEGFHSGLSKFDD